MNCLENIIGLTDKECECLTGEPPEGYNTSISGFFIDDLEDSIPLVIPKKTKDCGEATIWSLLSRAKKEGIRDFVIDFQKFFSANNQIRHHGFKGKLGELSSNQETKVSPDHLGVRFSPKPIKGLRMILRGFRTRTIQDNETVSRVTISNSLNSTTHTINQDISFSRTHNTTELSIPLILPLVDALGQPINYTFTYQKNYADTIKPANSTVGCNCGRNPEWERFGLLTGIFGSGTAYDLLSSKSKYNFGLQPICEITCEGNEFLCAPMKDVESESLNNSLIEYAGGDNLYRSHPYFITVAKLVQLYSINKVINSVIRSDSLNKFTILHDKKDLYARRSANAKKIEGHLMWLAENTPAEFVDCYSCRSNQRIKKITPTL